MPVFGYLVNPRKAIGFLFSFYIHSLVSSNWKKEIGLPYDGAGAKEVKSTTGCYTPGREGQKSKYEYK